MTSYLKITLIYLTFGVLWIFFSDKLLGFCVTDITLLTTIQMFKGWIYVGVTGLLLYLLIRRDYLRLAVKEREKETLFGATVQAMHHILNNFLNKMLVFRMEAQKSRDFNRDVFKLYDDVISEAKREIEKLGAISELTEEAIQSALYPEP